MWPTMELWTVLMSLYLSFGISAPSHLLELQMESMSRFEVAVREHQAHHQPHFVYGVYRHGVRRPNVRV